MTAATYLGTMSVQEFRHTSTQGFYLIQGKERIATAVYSLVSGWRLTWNVGQGEPVAGDYALDVMTEALDAWPSVRATIQEEPANTVHVSQSVRTVSTPAGGQPGYRR
ncbi:hypothetical protein ACFYMO_00680 [Streptomyces sp. NPDC007025]|uniref:hypothetical protein n=1 Tax=Streptomyces sp. NPDC007025 TaxID=3364771 RepID=UPI003678655A